ncbi:MAG: serine hydrolase [Chloroflexi bacterium]|uniref:serine hydrolase n=1 Tax=Candidatus Flexifilum breve TaxID=3140694 RepID=UPI003136BD98|nr:serine hydrolase [Chloroflexota bacterium]
MTTRLILFFTYALLMIAPSAAHAQIGPIGTDDLGLIWEQIVDQPGDVGIACMPLDNPANTVLYNANDAFPLASVTKLLIFIAYAQRLDSGELTFSELVNVDELDRYNLPRTDRGAHDRFMAQYPDNIQQISLWELALGMVQYSSNAASDYILNLLDPVDWDAIYRAIGITNTDYPNSLTMIPLLMNNHVTGKATLSEVDTLNRTIGEGYLDLYVNDEEWRAAEIEYRSGRGTQFPTWDVQTAILARHTANGSPSDFLQVLRAIYEDSNTALTENVKALTRLALFWSESDFIREWYLEFGSKLGFYSGGTLTLVAYGHPYDRSPVLSVIFFRDIPRSQYNDLVREDAIGNFAHWLNFNDCQGLWSVLPR